MKKRKWQFGLILLSSLGLAVIYLFNGLKSVWGNNQVFYDIVMREVAWYGLNKTGELNVVWGSLLLAFIVILLLVGVNCLNKKEICEVKLSNTPPYVYAVSAFAFFSLFFLFGGNVKAAFVVLAFGAIFLSLVYTKYDFKKVIFATILFYYTYFALKTVLALYDIYIPFQVLAVLFGAFLFAVILFCFCSILHCIDFYNEILMVVQLIFPLIFLSKINSYYSYNNQNIILEDPKLFRVFLYGCVLCIEIINALVIWSSTRKSKEELAKNVILPGTILVLFAIRLWPETSWVYSSDFWHTGEELLPWQQIVDLGQIPYAEYNSESGLYPLFFGLIHKLMGGKVTAYAYSWFLQYLIVNMVTGYLLYTVAGGGLALIICAICGAYDYNRTLLIIPSILLLCIYSRRNKNIQWLIMWVTFCFLNGLYYPIYGVAFLLGSSPYAFMVAKDALIEIKNKKKVGIVWKSACLLLCVCIFYCIPMMYRMALNVLDLSDQTTLADGISVLGNSIIPDDFLSFVKDYNIRNVLFGTYEFIIPISIAAIFFLLLLMWIVRGIKNKNFEKGIELLFLGLGAIMLPVTYTFGFVRMDTNWFLARTSVVLIIFTGIVLPVYLYKYCTLLNLHQRFCILLYCLFVSVYMIGMPIQNVGSVIVSEHNVPDNYVYVNDDTLGEGFVSDIGLYMIDKTKKTMDLVLEPEEDIFLLSGNQAFYYILGQKSYTPDAAIYAMADGKTQSRNIELLIENPPKLVLFDALSAKEYYIYNWLMKNGYRYYEDGGVAFFIEAERFADLIKNNVISVDQDWNDVPLDKFTNRDLEMTCTSWGNSLDSLMDIFEQNNSYKANILYENGECILEFQELITGLEADFLYIDLGPECKSDKIKVYWSNETMGYNDNNSFTMDVKNGKLLIPMGAAPAWLMADNISVKIVDLSNCGHELEIKNYSLYKLKNDRFYANK